MAESGWVVVIEPRSSWAKCYGPFGSYDETVEWLHANQFHPADCDIHPINPPALIPGARRSENMCERTGENWHCTRERGHAGRCVTASGPRSEEA